MPIRPENRARYPKDWRVISDAIRFGRAQGWCEFCRLAEHGKPHPITGSIVVLTVAHLDHTPETADPDQLAAMCQRCHNTYDRPHRTRTQATTRRAALDNGELFGVAHNGRRDHG